MWGVLSWDWYRDPRVLEVEERRLFRRSWQYIGPLESLSQPGDQVVGRISRVPVLVVRGDDGELRGFLNVCRHRGSLVVAADGNAPRLRCPYHAWTYNLDGALRSAPQCGPEIAAELPALGLVPVRVATFGPFVFASTSADGPPLDEVLGDLAEVIAGIGLDLGGLRRRQRFDYTLRANWKIHLENYLECYHCPVAHPGLSSVMEVGPGRYELTAAPHRLSHRAPVRAGLATGSATAGLATGSATAGLAAGSVTAGLATGSATAGLATGSVTAGSYHLLLPNVKININPGRQNLSIGPVYPDGAGKTWGFLDYYFGADADEAWIEQMMAFDGEVGDEDAALVAGAQAGVAGSPIDRGWISPQERLIADFQRYVHAACADEVPPGLR